MNKILAENIFALDDNLFQIGLPLPNNPLKIVNTYLIKARSKVEPNLLIDTAFNDDLCFDALIFALKKLDVDLDALDVFITHLHSDHSALCQKLNKYNKNINFLVSKLDGEIINMATRPDYWEHMTRIWLKNGFPDSEFLHHMNTHLGWEYHMTEPVDFIYKDDGDMLEYGGYKLRCIHTPGHSPGHLCLYDDDKKLLFAGDHILNDITPVIAPEYGFEDPLSHYMQSLLKISELEVKRVFVGHRTPPRDTRKKALELYEHHQGRLEEVKGILAINSGFSAYEVASRMKWDLRYERWGDFPPIQQWFATGEAMAHLVY